MQININSNAVVAHTNRLEKLHKSALPNAIRNTLNDVAMDVKKVTMPAESDKAFVHRSPTFFKANSRVEFAKGWNVNTMKSTVGFANMKPKGEHDYSVKDLEQQEEGGVIGGKSFIPDKKARIGNSNNSNVKANARIGKVRQKMVNRSNVKGKNWGQQMIKSAIHVGVGGTILTDSLSNFKGGAVFKVTSIKRSKGHTIFKSIKLYSFSKNRKVKVNSTHFMRTASLDSANKMLQMYIVNAEKQIARLTK